MLLYRKNLFTVKVNKLELYIPLGKDILTGYESSNLTCLYFLILSEINEIIQTLLK